ncbi:hypothetical protein AB0F42_11985 [Streptomyces buecherae]|uniref:hypothetical protein n=1 Tax=Streptomyces buecherae TaxID=2763006 RepID=UPI0033C1E68C
MRHVLGTVAVLAAAAGIVLAARPGVPEGPRSRPAPTNAPLSYAQCVEIASEIEYAREESVRDEREGEKELADQRGVQTVTVAIAGDFAYPAECQGVIEELAPESTEPPSASDRRSPLPGPTPADR